MGFVTDAREAVSDPHIPGSHLGARAPGTQPPVGTGFTSRSDRSATRRSNSELTTTGGTTVFGAVVGVLEQPVAPSMQTITITCHMPRILVLTTPLPHACLPAARTVQHWWPVVLASRPGRDLSFSVQPRAGSPRNTSATSRPRR